MTELHKDAKRLPVTLNFIASQPDEISVNKGDRVYILKVPSKSNDRVFVVKFHGDGSEESRGWLPKHVLGTPDSTEG